MRKSRRERRPRPGSPGITFLEIATILALAGMLSLVGHALANQAKKNAWRARGRGSMDRIYRSEILHCAVHGQFTSNFAALYSIGLPQPVDPVYRFSLHVPERSSFVCRGWANLDSDIGIDSLIVDETGVVRSLTRD